MKGLIISPTICTKLKEKHQVTPKEITQCFENCDGEYLKDTREKHKTEPPTLWFIAETNAGRRLKVVFILKGGEVIVKTVYAANSEEIRIYETQAR